MSKILRSNYLILVIPVLLSLMIGVNLGGCKSQKKALEVQEQAAREAELAAIDAAKTKLNDLLANNSLSVDEKQKGLDQVKAQNIQDDEVQGLITQLEEQITGLKMALAEEDRKRKEAEAAKAAGSPQDRLNRYFGAISSAPSLSSANQNIGEALQLFASDDVPVLIIIGKFQGENDYDEPTTIRKYLEYLKDQKKNPNNIENLVFDSNGQISEVELIKK